jgi:hypothetical protein
MTDVYEYKLSATVCEFMKKGNSTFVLILNLANNSIVSLYYGTDDPCIAPKISINTSIDNNILIKAFETKITEYMGLGYKLLDYSSSWPNYRV